MKVCYGHDHVAWMTHPCHLALTKTSFSSDTCQFFASKLTHIKLVLLQKVLVLVKRMWHG